MPRARVLTGLACAAALCLADAAGHTRDVHAQTTSSLSHLQSRAGAVSAEDRRQWLIGTWEPDADQGLPPGANTITYLDEGFYLNPFHGSVLVGIWSATADSIAMTPLEMRNLSTGERVPELMKTFGFIKWNEGGSTPLVWISRDRYQDGPKRDPWRRSAAVFDFTEVRAALFHDHLPGSWIDERGVEYAFAPDGRFTEVMSGAVLLPDAPLASDLTVSVSGTYRFDRKTQALRRRVEDVKATGLTLPATRNRILDRGSALDVTRVGERKAAALRWLAPDRVVLDGSSLNKVRGSRS